MERNEMVEVIMEKAQISREEAEAALDRNNGDMLEAILDLERQGKIKRENSRIIEYRETEENSSNEGNKSSSEEKCGGFGEIVGRLFRFVGKIIKKGNSHYFEIKKENEKPIRISLTISALLLIFLFVPTMILLVLGLFCGYKYSVSGNCKTVNDAFEKVSSTAEDIKKDFKEGYEGR